MRKNNGSSRVALGTYLFVLMLLGPVSEVAAQQGFNGGTRNPLEFLEQTQETARAGWSYLMIVAAFVVGGGALAVGGRALFRGDWQHGVVGIGFGIAVLLVLWGLGGFFGFNAQ